MSIYSNPRDGSRADGFAPDSGSVIIIFTGCHSPSVVVYPNGGSDEADRRIMDYLSARL